MTRRFAWWGIPVTLAALFVGIGTAVAHDPTIGVVPSSYTATGAPGDTFTVTKTVHTPDIAPNPDIFFLADTTGSMSGAINNVKTNAANVMATVLTSQPTAQFGAGEYKDVGDVFVYKLDQAMTPSTAAAQAGINMWSASGGGDLAEAQLFALDTLASSPATGFRTGSSRIVVWFGDAPGHDPSNGSTIASATASLNSAGARVIAISTGANGLDATGQATAITAATGGVFLPGASDSQVAAAILAGLANLPVTVSTQVTCAPELSVSLSPSTPQTVTSGDDVAYTETITISPSATPGTYGCTVDFLLDGNTVSGFSQTVSIRVVDNVAPTAACIETTNPSGGNVPPAKNQNPDGFYQLNARDNFDPNPQVFLADSGSTATFGGFPSGTKIKLTQSPGATPNIKPGAGDIDWKIQIKGDALVWAVDASGNASARVSCRVPPPPK
jgi:hypothetical protein